MKPTTLGRLLEQFSQRRLAILSDDLSPRSRTALVAPARDLLPATLNEALLISGSHVFVVLPPSRAKAFLLQPMGRPRTLPISDEAPELAMLESVEAREGVSTGISVADRAKTIGILGEEHPNPRKLVKPGHIFPIEAREGGVLVKSALPEGAADLVRLAAEGEAAVLIDLLSERGDYLSETEAQQLSERQSIPLVKLSDVVLHRLATEQLVQRVAEAHLPSRGGAEFRVLAYRSVLNAEEHVALVHGIIDPALPVPTRVHAERMLTDVFGTTSNSSAKILERAIERIGAEKQGVVVYLRTEMSPLPGPKKSPHAMRNYGIGAQILRDLGVKKIELLSSTPAVMEGLGSFDLEIVEQSRP